MVNHPKYSADIDDPSWGCKHTEVIYGIAPDRVKLCHVKVSDVQKIALELTKSVQDTSWIMNLDKGTRRSYEKTSVETALSLVEVFKNVASSTTIAGEFGELLVSIGSARALALIFNHEAMPIAELWKPQKKQNEGFDFHTTCSNDFINFGEAKYSSNASPHGNALSQAHDFIKVEKHYRDRVHLISLASKNAIENLDDGKFGVVAAFSINAASPLTIFNNALASAQKVLSIEKIETIYLVGVSN